MDFLFILFLILAFCVLLILTKSINNFTNLNNDLVMFNLAFFAIGFISILYEWSHYNIEVNFEFSTVHFIFHLPMIIVLCCCVFIFIFFLYFFCGDRFSTEEIIIILIALLLSIFAISSYDLISLYLVIEGINLCSFILILSSDKSIRSLYAALKYIVITLFTSILFLLSIWCIFYEWGTFQLPIQEYVVLSKIHTPVGTFGINLLVLTFCIKLGIAPFYSWLLDVYRNISLKALAFLNIHAKTVFSIVLCNIFYQISSIYFVWTIIFLMGLLSLIIGAMLLFHEKKVRGFIGIVSLMSTGFLFIAISTCIYSVLVFYIFVQALNILFFICFLCFFNHPNILPISFNSYRNYLDSSVFLFTIILFCGFSLIGIPPFAGFFPKILMLYDLYLSHMYLLIFIFILFTILMGIGIVRIFKNFCITNQTDFMSPALWEAKSKSKFILLAILFIIYNAVCIQAALFILII